MPSVTVVPGDRLIIVDGEAIVFESPFPAPSNLHALQWNGTSGEIEWTASSPHCPPLNAFTLKPMYRNTAPAPICWLLVTKKSVSGLDFRRNDRSQNKSVMSSTLRKKRTIRFIFIRTTTDMIE